MELACCIARGARGRKRRAFDRERCSRNWMSVFFVDDDATNTRRNEHQREIGRDVRNRNRCAAHRTFRIVIGLDADLSVREPIEREMPSGIRRSFGDDMRLRDHANVRATRRIAIRSENVPFELHGARDRRDRRNGIHRRCNDDLLRLRLTRVHEVNCGDDAYRSDDEQHRKKQTTDPRRHEG